MQVQFYSFPMETDGLIAIEHRIRELEQKEKQGQQLAQEEIDWVQYAECLLYAKQTDFIS